MSIAIPSAMLKINTVEGFSGTPAQPITPAVIINGIIFGISEAINILNDLNRNSMHNVINKKAHMILSIKP